MRENLDHLFAKASKVNKLNSWFCFKNEINAKADYLKNDKIKLKLLKKKKRN